MLTDVLLEKLELPATPGWSKTISPAQHDRLRSSQSVVVTSHMGYVPLVSYSISNTPITLAEGNRIKEIVGRAAGRPVLVRDPLDFQATAVPRINKYGTFRFGLLKSIGADYLSPTVCKVYGAVGPDWRVEDGLTPTDLKPVFLRPIFYVENGVVDIEGTEYSFVLDPITRQVTVNGALPTPPNNVLAAGTFNSERFHTYPVMAAAPEPFYGASFDHWTPMKVTEFTIQPISGEENQFPAVAGGRGSCEGYFLSMTLNEVIPQFDPLLNFYSTEINSQVNKPLTENPHLTNEAITLMADNDDPAQWPLGPLIYSFYRDDSAQAFDNQNGQNFDFFSNADGNPNPDNGAGGDGLDGGFVQVTAGSNNSFGAYVEIPGAIHLSQLSGAFDPLDYLWELKTRQQQPGGGITTFTIAYAVRQGSTVFILKGFNPRTGLGAATEYTQRTSDDGGTSAQGPGSRWADVDTGQAYGGISGDNSVGIDPDAEATAFGFIMYQTDQGANNPFDQFRLRDMTIRNRSGDNTIACYGITNAAAVATEPAGCSDPLGGGGGLPT
jgi:hypothetical protein